MYKAHLVMVNKEFNKQTSIIFFNDNDRREWNTLEEIEKEINDYIDYSKYEDPCFKDQKPHQQVFKDDYFLIFKDNDFVKKIAYQDR